MYIGILIAICRQMRTAVEIQDSAYKIYEGVFVATVGLCRVYKV